MDINNSIQNKEFKHRSTFAVLFYINRTKVRKDGMCQLLCKVSVDAKWEQIGIKVAVNPALWNPETGHANGRSENALTVNHAIDDLTNQIQDHYKRIKNSLGFVTAELIKNAMKGIGVKKLSLLALFREHNEEFKKRVGVDREKGSYASYIRSYKHLHGFIRDKKRTDDVSMKSLDQDFYDDFELYLRSDCGMQQKTVHEHLYRLKKMTKRAVNQGTLRRDPYDELHPQLPKRKSRHLKLEDLKTLMSTQLDKPNLQRVRDWFIFATFTGLSYADLKRLSEKDIIRKEDGSQWILIKRKKTDVPSFVRLLDIPLRIIEKYKSERKSDKIFNVYSRRHLISLTKKVGEQYGFYMTFHKARHNFGTHITLSLGIPIETVSRMMGHTSITTTQIYAEVKSRKVDEDTRALREMSVRQPINLYEEESITQPKRENKLA